MRVGHYLWKYLPLSEVFIHRQIQALPPEVSSYVFADRAESPDRFPLPRVHIQVNRRVQRHGVVETLRQKFETETKLRPRHWTKVFRRARLDLMHAHFGDNAAKILNAIGGMPLVVSFYGYDASRSLRENAVRMRAVFDRAERILALSQDMRSTLAAAGCDRKKIIVHPVGVDVPTKFGPTPKDGSVLIACRLVPKKGVDDALRAFAQVAPRFPKRRVDVVGDGPLLEDLRKLTVRLGISERVNFRGSMPLDELRSRIRRSTLLLHPSVTAPDGDKEGTPTVIMEAQAAGRPVIATRHGGIPEVVRHNQSGLLTKEHDAPALAEAIADLLRDPDKCARFGREGHRRMAREFNAATLGPRLASIYADVLGDRGVTGRSA